MVASNQTFVIAAYALTWVVLLGYVWRLVSKDRRARADHGPVSGRGDVSR
ncbi:MAG TPA: CcmD family protein [Gemmatimonadaceae bacterium]|nr:CcmD family protein [Gemmatimonadaceae bacterium]